MIEWLQETFIWWTSGWIGLLVYWVPAALCVVGYTFETISDYRRDVERRLEAQKSERDWYRPELKIGTILWRALISFVPVGNVIALIFDVLSQYAELVVRFLSIPLVPDKSK